MSRKKDVSERDKRHVPAKKKGLAMCYAALIGLIWIAFRVLPRLALPVFVIWAITTPSTIGIDFPEGTQIIEERDSHGGFLGDGVTLIAAQIPPETSEDFIQILWEKGFTDAPISEDIRYKLQNDPETCMAAEVFNGLWWFEEESPADCLGEYTNYTFHAYDLDTSIYYYIEYDS